MLSSVLHQWVILMIGRWLLEMKGKVNLWPSSTMVINKNYSLMASYSDQSCRFSPISFLKMTMLWMNWTLGWSMLREAELSMFTCLIWLMWQPNGSWNTLTSLRKPQSDTIPTPWEIENIEKTDDAEVFEFSTTTGVLKGTSLPLRKVPEGLLVPPVPKDEEEQKYLPDKIYIRF